MSLSPTVSVVMPTYNSAVFLKDAIDSVLSQTFKDWELIIVDDASTDDTTEVLSSYQHPQISIHKNEKNLGVSESRNFAIKLAKGEWIAFLDSDDVWHPEKLQRQLDHMAKENSNFSCTNVAWMDETSKNIGFGQPLPERITYKMLLYQNIIPLSSVILRRAILAEDKFENRGNEDFALWLRILRRGDYCTVLNDQLTTYRFRVNSRSTNKLKSAISNWRIYIEVAELPLDQAAHYMLQYVVRSLKKYSSIKK
jgi:teichuronic acid biosynthesis glycosyltransferase TuaG